MPAIAHPSPGDSALLPRAGEAISAISSLARRAVLEARSGSGAYANPRNMSAGVLVVFCLIGGGLGLLVWWLFIRRTGFIWRSSDWQDYKASVLRRPEERPDDAITVFSDGTARKGGGSSLGGPRTVVLGELDTTYTKSRIEKPYGPYGPREMGSGSKRTGLLMTAWSDVKGSVWGKLRGGEPSEHDTVVQREKSLRRERSRRRRRERRERMEETEETRARERRGHKQRVVSESEASSSFVDTQRPAPPLTDITADSRPSGPRRPARAPTKAGKAAISREPSYAPGDDKEASTARYHRHRRAQSHVEEESESESSSDSSDSDSSDESDSDDDSIDQSQLGMAKGNKVYHHPISAERVFWGNARPVERNGGGAGGTFGGGAPAVMPAPRGYRAASVGSLSSAGSVRSSNAGR